MKDTKNKMTTHHRPLEQILTSRGRTASLAKLERILDRQPSVVVSPKQKEKANEV